MIRERLRLPTRVLTIARESAYILNRKTVKQKTVFLKVPVGIKTPLIEYYNYTLYNYNILCTTDGDLE